MLRFFRSILVASATGLFVVACGPSGEAPETAEDAPAASAPKPTAGAATTPEAADVRPNVIVIVADDMGFSDFGAFGSGIRTPTLDALAAEGVVAPNFYVAPTCSPTRAMLMTGADHHRVGLGVMGEIIPPPVQGRPGYEGYLIDSAITLPQLLKDAGYTTYIAGKWHLGREETNSPPTRGFDQSFVLLQGGASHFADARGILEMDPKAIYRNNGAIVDELPEGFFSSTFYTDKFIEYIEGDRAGGAPFFGYLAYTAPHWPLQAPEDYIDRYRGAFDEGWEVWRERRLAHLKDLGLVPADVHLRPLNAPAWDSLSDEQKALEARRMELHAAMIEHMDAEIGRLVAYLEETDLRENTHIMFFSDNGPEGVDISRLMNNGVWIPANFDNSIENLGRVNSYTWLGGGWGQVSATPGGMFKSFTTEGGVRAPAIFSGAGVAGPRVVDEIGHVMDVAPTVLDWAGVELSDEAVAQIDGRSLAPVLAGQESAYGQPSVHGWELFGRRGVRQGDWKAVFLQPPFGPGAWQLFDVAADPAETTDLAAANPEKLSEMKALWNAYAEKNGVFVFEDDIGFGK